MLCSEHTHPWTQPVLVVTTATPTSRLPVLLTRNVKCTGIYRVAIVAVIVKSACRTSATVAVNVQGVLSSVSAATAVAVISAVSAAAVINAVSAVLVPLAIIVIIAVLV